MTNEEIKKAAALLGREGGQVGGKGKSDKKTASCRENAKRPRISEKSEIQIKNPWSDHWKTITWGDVKEFAAKYTHESDRDSWIRTARRLFRQDNGVELGRMIRG